jgi:nitrogen regulatory protein PII
MTSLMTVRGIVRLAMLDRVIHALRGAGVPRLTVTRVHAIGAGVDPATARLSVEESAEYADKALVEFVCGSEAASHLTGVLCEAAHTGRRGDGIVYALPVAEVVKIRTGTAGLEALR